MILGTELVQCDVRTLHTCIHEDEQSIARVTLNEFNLISRARDDIILITTDDTIILQLFVPISVAAQQRGVLRIKPFITVIRISPNGNGVNRRTNDSLHHQNAKLSHHSPRYGRVICCLCLLSSESVS